MTTKNMTPRTIALSEETAELFTAKRLLDECFNKVGEIHGRLFCRGEQFNDRLDNAYVAFNSLIMDLLAERIDNNSTESKYKVI